MRDVCPACAATLEGSVRVAGAPGCAEPGDLSICRECGAILRFGEDLRLYIPDEAELRPLRLMELFGDLMAHRLAVLERIEARRRTASGGREPPVAWPWAD